MIYYFAYGSNLHPMRLMERVPSAELVGVAKHPNHVLTFHKKSNDGSSKCNMFNSGSGLIFGAIYKLNPEHKNELDRFEGKGYGYIDNQITLEHNETEYSCFTYLAQQSHINYISIYYADVLANPAKEVDKLTAFLSIDLNKDTMISAIDPLLYRQKNTYE